MWWLVLWGWWSIETLTAIKCILLWKSTIIHGVAIGITVVAEPTHRDIHVSVAIRVVHVPLLLGVALLGVLVGLVLLGRWVIIWLCAVLLRVWLLRVLLELILLLALGPLRWALCVRFLTLDMHGLVVSWCRCLRNAIDLGVILIQFSELDGIRSIFVD